MQELFFDVIVKRMMYKYTCITKLYPELPTNKVMNLTMNYFIEFTQLSAAGTVNSQLIAEQMFQYIVQD